MTEHTHTVVQWVGPFVQPLAMYWHWHPYLKEEHDHEDLPRLELAILKDNMDKAKKAKP